MRRQFRPACSGVDKRWHAALRSQRRFRTSRRSGSLERFDTADQTPLPWRHEVSIAAIVVRNTMHLQACLRRLRADGYRVDDADFRFLSPLTGRHLGIDGQYTFNVQRYG